MRVLFLTLITACFLQAQTHSHTYMIAQQNDIPVYPGDEGTGDHKGQPVWCQARDVNGHKKNCGICDMKCVDGKPAEEHSTCKTYCRKGACQCSDSCIPTGRLKRNKPEIAVAVVWRLDNQFTFKQMFFKLVNRQI